MIKAEHINKSFGTVQVLKDICFSASEREIIAIVGASGAGKSTLLQILGSLMKPDSGSVTIDSTDIFSLSDKNLSTFRNRKIGFVFQAHHLLAEFSALENVMLPALIAGRSRKQAKEMALPLLETVGLSHRISHKPSELSGGEQQRVAIARALVNNPSVVFADEPTGNLDSLTKEDIHRLFFSIRDKFGVTIVLVTHDRDLAGRCDRTVEMKDGVFI